jgi:hypothetical protein
MFKTFNLGVVLGIALAAAVVYAYPIVDQHRERSLISVHANGGNSELFYINLPDDRIMAGVPDSLRPTPPGLEWPAYDFLTDIQTEIFKLRNEDGIVVGTANRMSGNTGEHGPFIEWVLHFPARGSIFVTMGVEPLAEGVRQGNLRAGTREFLPLNGVVLERFVQEDIDPELGAVGRIELAAALVGPLDEVE